jgi:hypothetical protein
MGLSKLFRSKRHYPDGHFTSYLFSPRSDARFGKSPRRQPKPISSIPIPQGAMPGLSRGHLGSKL